MDERWNKNGDRRATAGANAVVRVSLHLALLVSVLHLFAGVGAAEIYFGDLHAHSSLSDDATGDPENFFLVARDVAGLDFVALSDHDAFLTDAEWNILRSTAASFHVPGRFVAFTAVEWTHRWHMNAIFDSDDVPYCSSSGCPEAADFYDFYGPTIRANHAAAHVNHPADLFKVNWLQIDDTLTTSVEVWNTAGAGDNEPGFGNALWALRAGFRLGLVGVSDDHHTDLHPPLLGTGLTGCHADSLTREDLLASLRDRRCYATSGERIALDTTVAGIPMGGDAAARIGDRVPVHVEVGATATPVVIELLVNGDVVRRQRCTTPLCDLDGDVRITQPSTFVYARVVQPGNERAWSSPVWVHSECSPSGTGCLTARMASGGGRREDDCLAEWLLASSTGGGTRAPHIRCTDGDRGCDFGTAAGECTVRIGLCRDVADPRIQTCAPGAVDSFDVLSPGPEYDVRETPEYQNRQTLLTLFHAAETSQPPIGICSPLAELRVPLGHHVLETKTSSGSRTDDDLIVVDCLPRLARGARLPFDPSR